MAIQIRTVSMLPSTNTIVEGDLIEVSQMVGQSKYNSCKIRFEDMQSQIRGNTKDDIKQTYDMVDSDGNPISLKTVRQDIDDLKTNSITIGGLKTFETSPIIMRSEGDETIGENNIPTVRNVRTMIQEYGQYYSSESYLPRNPLNVLDGDGKQFNGSVYTEKDANNPFYYWHISDEQNDSSYFEDDRGNNTVTMKESGILNIYGWLADNGTTLAQESWVGLFTKIYVEQSKTYQWTPINIQPWIQGKKSSIMQYVSFNGICVVKGTELKIVSGFNVNGKNSGLGSGNSLLFKDFGYTANTFIGYVVQK